MINKFQLVKSKKLWHKCSETVATFDLNKLPLYIKKDIPKAELDLALQLPMLPVDGLIVVNELFPGWETLRNLLVAMDTIPRSLLEDLYQMEKKRYPNDESAAIKDEDSASEQARKITFMFIPELLKAQSKKHI